MLCNSLIYRIADYFAHFGLIVLALAIIFHPF